VNEVFPQGMKVDFGDIVEALPGLVWTTQADGRSDFLNRAWREYTGLGLDEATGYGWQTAIHPDDLASFAQSWNLISHQASAGRSMRDCAVSTDSTDGSSFGLRRYRRNVGVGSVRTRTRTPRPTAVCVACSA
jgi:PAS domain S-box-containing protein